MIDIESVKKTGVENLNIIIKKRSAFHHQLLIPASTLLGLLIALHNENSHNQYIRLCFALATFSLAIGILLCSVSLYNPVSLVKMAQQAYIHEVNTALKEHRDIQPALVSEKKIYTFSEIGAYICFAIAILLLSVYSLLVAFSCF